MSVFLAVGPMVPSRVGLLDMSMNLFLDGGQGVDRGPAHRLHLRAGNAQHLRHHGTAQPPIG